MLKVAGVRLWLEEQLDACDLPTFVCLHHPPVRIGVELMDPSRLRDPEALAAVIERHPHVVAVLAGYAHIACASTYAQALADRRGHRLDGAARR